MVSAGWADPEQLPAQGRNRRASNHEADIVHNEDRHRRASSHHEADGVQLDSQMHPVSSHHEADVLQLGPGEIRTGSQHTEVDDAPWDSEGWMHWMRAPDSPGPREACRDDATGPTIHSVCDVNRRNLCISLNLLPIKAFQKFINCCKQPHVLSS